MDYSLRINYYCDEIDYIIQRIDVAEQSYRCDCGTHVDTGKTHCQLHCLTVESERRISMAYTDACNVYGCGHDWANRERGIALFKVAPKQFICPKYNVNVSNN